MKIGLLSDTHSYIDDNMLSYFNDRDEIWHAGDIGDFKVVDKISSFKPLKAVYGNIDDSDIRNEFPLDLRFFANGLDVLITHIGGYPGRYNARIHEILANNPPDLFICGHSHILKVIYDKNFKLLHINPGACGHHGFHKIRTMVRFSIENATVKNLQIIELGQRGL